MSHSFAFGCDLHHSVNLQSRLLSVTAADPTAASQRLVFDEIAETADLIHSFAIGLLEAARRADRVRVHGYIADPAWSAYEEELTPAPALIVDLQVRREP